MSTKAARDKKAQLEKDIRTLIESYEEDTGTTVEYINIERVDVVSMVGESDGSKLTAVDAEVSL